MSRNTRLKNMTLKKFLGILVDEFVLAAYVTSVLPKKLVLVFIKHVSPSNGSYFVSSNEKVSIIFSDH